MGREHETDVSVAPASDLVLVSIDAAIRIDEPSNTCSRQVALLPDPSRQIHLMGNLVAPTDPFADQELDDIRTGQFNLDEILTGRLSHWHPDLEQRLGKRDNMADEGPVRPLVQRDPHLAVRDASIP